MEGRKRAGKANQAARSHIKQLTNEKHTIMISEKLDLHVCTNKQLQDGSMRNVFFSGVAFNCLISTQNSPFFLDKTTRKEWL